jgi:hypothetical protein
MNTGLDAAPLLADWQIEVLRQRLRGRLVSLSFGAGVDSTAMLVALREADLIPQLISMADTGGEKPETMQHVDRVNEVLQAWGWPSVTLCKKATMPGTGYEDLYGNCLANETLPSLAFGMKSCSLKWKTSPQDQMLRGVSKGPNRRDPHPLWLQAKANGERIVKLIGYDCGKADLRRSKAVSPMDADFEYVYPLQLLRWTRPDCVSAIALGMGPHLVPIKSACFFCPASKHWELFWLAAMHPELLERALRLEWVALTGRHSRFDKVEFGAGWEDLVRNAESFPSTNTCVGLGRSFSWNQWARVNGVVDAQFRVIREKQDLFLATSDALRGSDNALDARSGQGISIEQLRSHRTGRQLDLALV